MLQSMRRLFEGLLPGTEASAAGGDEGHALKVAAAALLAEMVHADATATAEERQRVAQLLRREFGLDATEAKAIQALGETAREQAVSLFEFTHLLDRRLDREQKLRLLGYLWEVAFSDGQLDKYEEYLVRKLADLLHLSHADLIRIKHRVLGGDGSTTGI